MGRRTSIYLSDELDEAWRASGVKLAELVRRGLAVDPPLSEGTLRLVLAEMLPPAAYATPVGTGIVALVDAPPADMPGTTHVLTAVEAYDEPAAEPCAGGRHPSAAVIDGYCHECRTELD